MAAISLQGTSIPTQGLGQGNNDIDPQASKKTNEPTLFDKIINISYYAVGAIAAAVLIKNVQLEYMSTQQPTEGFPRHSNIQATNETLAFVNHPSFRNRNATAWNEFISTQPKENVDFDQIALVWHSDKIEGSSYNTSLFKEVTHFALSLFGLPAKASSSFIKKSRTFMKEVCSTPIFREYVSRKIGKTMEESREIGSRVISKLKLNYTDYNRIFTDYINNQLVLNAYHKVAKYPVTDFFNQVRHNYADLEKTGNLHHIVRSSKLNHRVRYWMLEDKALTHERKLHEIADRVWEFKPNTDPSLYLTALEKLEVGSLGGGVVGRPDGYATLNEACGRKVICDLLDDNPNVQELEAATGYCKNL